MSAIDKFLMNTTHKNENVTFGINPIHAFRKKKHFALIRISYNRSAIEKLNKRLVVVNYVKKLNSNKFYLENSIGLI